MKEAPVVALVGRVRGQRLEAVDDGDARAPQAGEEDLSRAKRVFEAEGLDWRPLAVAWCAAQSKSRDTPAAAGAEWIDEIAAAARVAIMDREAVVAHGDWSARNIRLGPAGLVCAYDWESLQYGPESKALGVAAATWRSLGEPNEPLAPSAPEIQRYIDLYERARRRPLSENQRRSACAAAVFALAYTARCEHALHPGTREGRASGRLARDNGLLSLIP